MGKKSKKKQAKHDAQGGMPMPIGFTSTMPIAVPIATPSDTTPSDITQAKSTLSETALPASQPLGSLPPIQVAGAQASAVPPFSVPPLAAVPPSASPSSSVAGSFPDSESVPRAEQALVQDAQRRLVDLAVEKETLAVRLEDAARQRAELEARVAELSTLVADLRTDRSGSQDQLAAVISERDKLQQENRELQDEILRLPVELEAVSKSRAFRIMKAAPILAIRKPLSTLLIVGAMGALANLWDFSNIARTIYLVVGSIVLLVSAIQFLARNDER